MNVNQLIKVHVTNETNFLKNKTLAVQGEINSGWWARIGSSEETQHIFLRPTND